MTTSRKSTTTLSSRPDILPTMPAPSRPLTIVSSDPEVVQQAQAGALAAGDAVSQIAVLGHSSELSMDQSEGQVLVDPRVVEGSVHEWVLGLVRQSRVLVWILTDGDWEDADGLARFVGAQGALSMPLDAETVADRLASPFGAPAPVRPQPGEPDAEGLVLSLDAILGNHDSPGAEDFHRNITLGESGLYHADYWQHRLDEEFKRSMRFRFPLGVVSFVANEELDDSRLLDLAGVVLLGTRDVDIVALFDPRTLVALLPHTGPAGTKLFGDRVSEALGEEFGDSVQWNVHTVCCPDTSLATSSAVLTEVLGVTTS